VEHWLSRFWKIESVAVIELRQLWQRQLISLEDLLRLAMREVTESVEGAIENRHAN
jgi:hypothetical protein